MNNDYGIDYFAENEKGDQMPMANVFVRRNGGIRHFWGSEMLYADIEGQPRHEPGREPQADYRVVTTEYLSVMGIPLLRAATPLSPARRRLSMRS